MRDPVAKTARPLRELKAFQRVPVQPGERVTVTFLLGGTELGYYTKTGDFVVEPGEFLFYVGENCLSENKVSVRLE